MAKAKALTGATLTCIAAVGLSTSGFAQSKASDLERTASAREAATNAALLKSLVARRAEIVRLPGHAEGKREALDFLDKKIARVKMRSDK